MSIKRNLILAAVLAVAVPLGAGEPVRWLNVHVTDTAEEADVKVHLPMTLVLAVLDGIDVEGFHKGRVELELDDDVDIDWPAVMTALRDAPDGEFVTVASREADVTVRKQGGTMRIHVSQKEDEHAQVDVTVPSALIDALSIDDENHLDVRSLLASLDSLPDGDLVTVTSREANVRIWIE